jgi:hypothetical protein
MTSPTQKILARVTRIVSSSEKQLEPGIIKITLYGNDAQWLTEAVKELSQALEFYGDSENWSDNTLEISNMRLDFDPKSYLPGYKARAALVKVAGDGGEK